MRDVYVSVCKFGKRFRRRFAELRHDDSGATAVEYGLILAGLSLLILIAVFAMGDALEGLFNHVRTTFANAYSS